MDTLQTVASRPRNGPVEDANLVPFAATTATPAGAGARARLPQMVPRNQKLGADFAIDLGP